MKKKDRLIRINLTPFDELQNKTWWVPDVLAIIAAVFAIKLVSKKLDNQLKEEISRIDAEISDINENIENIKTQSTEISKEQKILDEAEAKLKSYDNVSFSDINRFEFIIIMEYMHTLKPYGMWYKSLNISISSKNISVDGKVKDPTLISDFLKSLSSTQNQEDLDDIRNKIYFTDINLQNFGEGRVSLANLNLKKTIPIHDFKMSFNYRIRES